MGNLVNTLVPQEFILGPTLFLLYIIDLSVEFICNIAFYADDAALYSKCDQLSDLWQQLESFSWGCYLELLDKLQKWVCRTVDPSITASLKPLVHRRNVASLSLFYRHYFGRCSSEMAKLVPLPYS